MHPSTVALFAAFLLGFGLAQFSQEQCHTVSCEGLGDTNCISTDSTQQFTMKLNQIYCNNNNLMICDINDQLNGVCKTINEYNSPKILYPGDPCDPADYLSTCAYGLQQCSNLTCQGVGFNGSCSRTYDCEPGQFCSSGKCQNYFNIGDKCTHRFECGRRGTCFFNETKSLTGTCVKYFTFAEGSSVLSRQGTYTSKEQFDSINCDTLFLEFDDDTRLLCKSGYMSREGKCDSPPSSTQKGSMCTSSIDCDTTEKNVKSSCICSRTANRTKYCDIMDGDDLWLEELQHFKNYWNATTDVCNAAARWEECGGKALEYYAWKCSYFTAKHYVLELYKYHPTYEQNMSCFQSYLSVLPDYKDVQSYCSKYEMLKGSAILLAVSLLVMLLSIYVFHI